MTVFQYRNLLLSIRELLLELIRPLELPADGFSVVPVVGLLVLIELPIRELLLELIRPLELPADGFSVVPVVGLLVLIELPIRELLLELIRLLELADDCLPVPELTAVGLLLLRVLLDGLRVLEVAPVPVVTGRLDVILLGGRTLRMLLLLELVLRRDELRGAALLLELLRTEGLDVLVLIDG